VGWWEEEIDSMLLFVDTNGGDLLNRLKNLSVKKVQNIERKKDDRGNFTFLIETKSNSDDLELPIEIKFTVPVFKHHPETIELIYSIYFDYNVEHQNEEPKANMYLTLKNYSAEDIIETKSQEIIEKYLKNFKTKNIYWGSSDIVLDDDSWKYISH